MSGRRWIAASGCSASPRRCRRKLPDETAAARSSCSKAAGAQAALSLLPVRPRLCGRMDNVAPPAKQAAHAPPPLRLVRRRRRQAPRDVGSGRVSFAESSFFPAPPDVMLIPMSLARPDQAWFFAAVCTVGVGRRRPVRLFHRRRALCHGRSVADPSVRLWRQGRGVPRGLCALWRLIILLKGLTPIPYKIVTITSGFAGFNSVLFVILSVITRGARFFLRGVPAQPLRRPRPRHHRGAARDYGPRSARRSSSLALSSSCGYSDPSDVGFGGQKRRRPCVRRVGGLRHFGRVWRYR